jgi:ribonuclease HII
LSPKQRELAAAQIHRVASDLGLGKATAMEVDKLGLIPATRLAMKRSLSMLQNPPAYLLIDHLQLPDVDAMQKSITRGDRSVLSIAAASILAKVHRDQIMEEMDRQFPKYGFARHKGYGTFEHRQALLEAGPCLIHRKSYKPIAELVD